MSIKTERIEVEAEGELDLAGTLGITKDVPVGFERIRLRLGIDAPEATEEQLKSLQELPMEICPSVFPSVMLVVNSSPMEFRPSLFPSAIPPLRRNREPCEASQDLVEEAQHDIEESQTDAARDALINTAVAKVEHYEIANYRSLITGARLMGHTRVVNLLEKNLHQEEETVQIAENGAEELLRKASQEPGGQNEGPRVSVH